MMRFKARSNRSSQRAGARCAAALLLAACALAADLAPLARAQTRLPGTENAPSLPEPIYWKQDLFLVPYQWGSAAEASAAQAVWLFVSKDGGATWHKISEARPNVTSFNYRAEGDGEYWFAVRTIDAHGRAWPTGAYRPELRVIVDTMMPQITQVSATRLETGAIDIRWSGADAHLDPTTWRFEAQTDAAGTWQSVAIENAASAAPVAATAAASPVHRGQALWTPPPGVQPTAIRATVADRAGNAATYQAPIALAPAGASMAAAAPNHFATAPALPASLPAPAAAPGGWVSSTTAAVQAAPPPATQPWPAAAAPRAPFRLFSRGPTLPDDGITAYGDPPTVTAPQLANDDSSPHRVEARYAMNSHRDAAAVMRGSADAASSTLSAATGNGSLIAPLEPFRQAAAEHAPSSQGTESWSATAPTSQIAAPPHQPPAQPKLVGSRTFALEYDLEYFGGGGVTRVELWGTRDGGRSWQRYAVDDDHRSPLIVTVEDEGLYGFRILVESAGTVAQAPTTGEEPELWVAVDLHRPTIELTAIERGQGNLSDHLILRWTAADDNLEPRPISLFYSSLPAGPWSAIATNLEDTGAYAWRVERHVPSRFYIRAEARDTAGNLAAFQTREPIEMPQYDPSVHLQSAAPVGQTATGGEAGYR